MLAKYKPNNAGNFLVRRSMTKSLEIVNRFFELTAPKGRKIESLLPKIKDLLVSDFTFTGPLMRIQGRDSYLDLLGQFLAAHNSLKIINQFEKENEVCSINELVVNTPSGEAVSMRMAEVFKLKDGLISEHELFYDPREFSKAFGM